MSNTPPPPPRNYRVSCPMCSAKLNCTAKVLGKRVRCSSCGHEFVTPELILPGVDSVGDSIPSDSRRPTIERGVPSEHSDALPKIDTARRSENRKKHLGRTIDTKLNLIYKAAFFLSIATLCLSLAILSIGATIGPRSENPITPGNVIAVSALYAIAFPVALATYLMPTLIAYLREHRNVVPIAVINLCSGWFFLPWVGCLAWSFSSHIEESRRTVRVIRVNERNEVIEL